MPTSTSWKRAAATTSTSSGRHRAASTPSALLTAVPESALTDSALAAVSSAAVSAGTPLPARLQESWSGLTARKKFIRGKLVYQKDVQADEYFARPYVYREGSLEIAPAAAAEEVPRLGCCCCCCGGGGGHRCCCCCCCDPLDPLDTSPLSLRRSCLTPLLPLAVRLPAVPRRHTKANGANE